MPRGCPGGRCPATLGVLASLLAAAACNDDDRAPLVAPDNTVSVDHPQPVPAPPCPSLPPPRGFVTRDGSELTLDGARFRAVGVNLYYLQQLFAYGERGDAQAAADARLVLDHALCLGAGVVRAWGFNDTDDSAAIRSAPTAWRELGLRGLDRLVAEARARGLRVILTLVNNHKEYGGLPAYAAWAGKPPERADDFFGDPTMMGYWKDYASMLAARVNTVTGVAYRDEPAILAWELGNEFRCKSCRGTDRFVTTVRELARHARATFPNHLLGDGGDGLDDAPGLYPGLSNVYAVRGDEGASFSKLLTVDELDMVSYHFYPGPLSLDAEKDAQLWMGTHELLARMAGKVGYFGEFGHDPRPAVLEDAVRARTFNQWLSFLFNHRGGSLAMLWQLVPENRLARPLNDGYAVTYGVHPRASAVLAFWAGVVARRP